MKKNILAVLLALWSVSALPAWCEKFAVVFSRTMPPYAEALRGFRQGGSFEIVTLNLEGNMANGPQVVRGLAAAAPDGILVFGAEALSAIKNQTPNVPLLYTMLLEQPQGLPAKTAGVLMQIPLEEQMDRLRKLLPDAKKIGVIYTPAFSLKTVNQARTLAAEYQMTLVPIAVEEQSEVGGALEKLKEANVDALWSVVDKTVAQPQVVEQCIQFCLSHKLAFIGLSVFHVKAGALAAFSVDYNDLGAQTASLAKRMLSESLQNHVETPRKIIIYINNETRKRIGLKDIGNLPAVQVVQ